MADRMLGRAGLAAAASLALVSLAFLPSGAANAAMPGLALSTQPSQAVKVAKDGPRFHHGKRVQSAYCLRRNYWWFYRPYTTAPEDLPRCEPYFHYPERASGRRGARVGPYFK